METMLTVDGDGEGGGSKDDIDEGGGSVRRW